MIETERLIIRELLPTEFELYMRTIDGTMELKEVNSEVFYSFAADSFENLFNNSGIELFGIFEKESNNLYGKLELQHYEDGDELGIFIIEEFRNKGIGPEAIVGFGKWLSEEKSLSHITVRIDTGNEHSRHVFEKLGAEFIEQRSSLSSNVRKVLTGYMPIEEWDKIGPYFYKLPLPVEE